MEHIFAFSGRAFSGPPPQPNHLPRPQAQPRLRRLGKKGPDFLVELGAEVQSPTQAPQTRKKAR